MKTDRTHALLLCLLSALMVLFLPSLADAAACRAENEPEEPFLNDHTSVYAEIPGLGISYGFQEDTVRYGASCTKFIYTYYAYCVMDWGSVELPYAEDGNYVITDLKECARLILTESSNAAAHAIFEYIRTDTGRRADYLEWLKEILDEEVPVFTAENQYRLGYDSAAAYCPFTTAVENVSLWKYVWKDGYDSDNLNLQRYEDFFSWCSTGWLCSNEAVKAEYGKNGWLDLGGEWSVRTNGAFYLVELADGNEYVVFLSYLEDCFEGDEIWETVGEVMDYVIRLGNQELHLHKQNGEY